MSGTNTLNEIYELIEAEKLEEARTLLQPLLESDADNPDVWWLYAHAVEDADAGRKALEEVSRQAPDYPGLRAVMSEAGIRPAPVKPLSPPPGLPEMPTSTDSEGDSGDFDDPVTDTTQEERSRRLPVLLLAGVGLILVIIVGALALLNPGGTGPATPTATQVAQNVNTEQATIPPTTTVQGTETTIPNTDVPTAVPEQMSPTSDEATDTGDTAGQSDLAAALAAFDIAENGINTQSTANGETLVVNVCSPVGPRAGTILNDVMKILAEETSSEDALDQLAVSLTDCDNDIVLRSVAVSYEDAASYAAGELTDREFQGRWQPIDLDA